MRNMLDYDNTYKKALATKDPIAFINNRWGDPKPYFDQFVKPYIKDGYTSIEIGSGFGRYTQLLQRHSKLIYAIDASDVCRSFLKKVFNTEIKVLPPGQVGAIPDQSLDIGITFSTMLHFNQYEIGWYMKRLEKKMHSGAKFVLHYADLNAASGSLKSNVSNRFGDVGRYNFYVPAMIKAISSEFGFRTLTVEEPKKPIVRGHMVAILSRR